jgi:hypothetical protein
MKPLFQTSVPTKQNDTKPKVKKGWGCGSSLRATAQQAQGKTHTHY